MNFGVWINCNGAPKHTEENPRALSWALARNGWGPMAEELAIAAAGRMLVLHNPFGRSGVVGDDNGRDSAGNIVRMEFDQELNCQAKAPHVASSLKKAMPRLVGSCSSVVMYIGAPHNTPRMEALRRSSGRAMNWFWNAWSATDHWIDAGCDIAIDNMGGTTVPLYEANWIRSLRDIAWGVGRKVYIEATTEYSSPLHNQFGMIVMDDSFKSRHQNALAGNRYPQIRVPSSWYQYDVRVMIPQHEYAGTLLRDRVMQLNDWGLTPLVHFKRVGELL